MKVERKEADFAPIVLTIESQMELDILSELVSLGEGSSEDHKDANQFLASLTKGLLYEGASTEFHYFCHRESKLVAK